MLQKDTFEKCSSPPRTITAQLKDDVSSSARRHRDFGKISHTLLRTENRRVPLSRPKPEPNHESVYCVNDLARFLVSCRIWYKFYRNMTEWEHFRQFWRYKIVRSLCSIKEHCRITTVLYKNSDHFVGAEISILSFASLINIQSGFSVIPSRRLLQVTFLSNFQSLLLSFSVTPCCRTLRPPFLITKFKILS